MNIRDKRIIIIVFTTLLLAGGLIIYLNLYNDVDNRGTYLPRPRDEMAGYRLVEYKSGEEAIQSLGNIHFFLTTQDTVVDGLVAIYAKNSDVAHIWAVAYKTPEEAQMMTQRMYTKMTEAETPYTPPETRTLNGVTIYTGEGNNMYYIFYNKENKVIWISMTGTQEDVTNFAAQAINNL